MRVSASCPRPLLTLILLTGSMVLLAGPLVRAQNNIVDPVFGGAGLGIAGNVQTLAMQADGKLLVSGAINGLARLNLDGSTDTSFNVQVDEPPTAVAVQSDGKIVVVGLFTRLNGVASTGLARLNTDGSTDPGFYGNSELALAANAESVALQSDGKILVAGLSLPVDGETNSGIVRLNTDGTLDTSFHAGINLSTPGGKKIYGVLSVVPRTSGKVIIAGFFTDVDGVARNSLARLHADGSVDRTFAFTAKKYPIFEGLLAVQPDGKLIVSGLFPISKGKYTSLARLNIDGSLDTTFVYAGKIQPSFAAVAPDGQILLEVENFAQGGATITLSRVNADGSADTSFNATINGELVSLFPQADGTVFVGGSFSEVNGVGVNSVAKLNADGSVDNSYAVDVSSGPNGEVDCLAVQTDGKVIIGGAFTAIDDATHLGIARLKSDGTPDATFSASADSAFDGGSFTQNVHAVAVQSDGKILLGGLFTRVDGVASPGFARLNTDGSLDTTFNVTFQGIASGVATITLQADGKILVSGYGDQNGDPIPFVRLNSDGSLDSGFNVALSSGSILYTVALQPDAKILVGGYELFGTAGQNLVRLNPDGSVDTSFDVTFDSGAGEGVDTLAVQPDGKILLGGTFSAVDGAAAANLARVNADGSLDTGFSASTDSGVSSLVAAADGTVVIAGFFSHADGVARQGLAHLGADGSLNPFVPVEAGVGTSGYIDTLVEQPDGTVLLGGNFNRLDGALRDYVAELDKSGIPDFFGAGVPVGGGFYYLEFPDGKPFGYYNLAGSGYAFPYFYHADLGMEYFYDAQDTQGGAYLYDFASSTFFYTSPTFSFPYLYDFTLNSVVYYYPDPNNPGRYNVNGIRYFYDFNTGTVISK